MSAQHHTLPWAVDGVAAPAAARRAGDWDFRGAEAGAARSYSSGALSGAPSSTGAPLPVAASTDGGSSIGAEPDGAWPGVDQPAPHWGYIQAYYSEAAAAQQESDLKRQQSAPAAALSAVGGLGRRALAGLASLLTMVERAAAADATSLPRTAQQAEGMDQRARDAAGAFMDLDPIHGARGT